MKIWVYIYECKKDDFKITLSTSDDAFASIWEHNLSIIYLRPFEIAFDAIAHKHLLDSLSKKSVLDWVDKHKDETKAWLHIYNKNKTK